MDRRKFFRFLGMASAAPVVAKAVPALVETPIKFPKELIKPIETQVGSPVDGFGATMCSYATCVAFSATAWNDAGEMQDKCQELNKRHLLKRK